MDRGRGCVTRDLLSFLFFLFIWIIGIYFLRSKMKNIQAVLVRVQKKILAAMRMETVSSISTPSCIYCIRYTYIRIYVYTPSKLSKTQRTIIQIRLEKSGWAHHMDRARGRHVWLSTHRHGRGRGRGSPRDKQRPAGPSPRYSASGADTPCRPACRHHGKQCDMRDWSSLVRLAIVSFLWVFYPLRVYIGLGQNSEYSCSSSSSVPQAVMS